MSAGRSRGERPGVNGSPLEVTFGDLGGTKSQVAISDFCPFTLPGVNGSPLAFTPGNQPAREG